jgi:hypothetical protein
LEIETLKILLYDVDSVLPNIALMKLSTFHKEKGDKVEIIKGNSKPTSIKYSKYDKGYASVVFTKNKALVKDFPFEIGGTGYNIETRLDISIEHLMPDYSLYPENEYSIGFATRGCVRKCSFCFVPKKEGLLCYNANINEFYDPKLKKIMLLDNNIFAYSGYKDIFEQIRKINKPTCFKQGMDFRLLTDEKVNELLSIRYDGDYIFAYDSINIRNVIESQMNKFRNKFDDWKLKFFVLVGFDTTLKQDVFRINYLRDLKILPYIMRYESCYDSPYKDFYTDLASWCNQVFAFKKLTFEEFLYRRHTSKNSPKRIEFSLKLWRENL